jgi:hypothetical protein
VDLESVARELYGLSPNEFTAARDARASEARAAGDRTLASSIKKLRKPTVGAWLANVLARERTKDVDRLIDLGAQLRAARSGPDGDRIRRASRERNEAIARLVRDAKAVAARRGQPVSAPAVLELEATLDAAFADQTSAELLRSGRLTTALQYSGLGLSPRAEAGSGRHSDERPRSTATVRKAEHDLQSANRDAERADTLVEEARRAVHRAQDELARSKGALAEAQRRAKAARQKAGTAEKSLNEVRGRRLG